MKYFYDTEFIEDGKTIDLISIGIVCEDGRTYYAISKEFNPEKADQWVKDNVLSKLPERNVNLLDPSISPRVKEESLLWKSREEIKNDIVEFIGEDKPELWAYYADYDHIALCQLFGRMIDLPENFPFYTMDIKQFCKSLGDPQLPEQENEHDALDDAKWNKIAYEYLKNYKPNPTLSHG